MKRSLLILLLPFFYLAACGSPPTKDAATRQKPSDQKPDDDSPRTSVVLLIDTSRSFAPFGDQDRTALTSITDAMLSLSGQQWDVPVRFYWSAFGASSLFSKALCGPPKTYRQRLISGIAKNDEITQTKLLREWFDACVDTLVRSKQIDDYTDLSGAIGLAAESQRSFEGKKVLIIYSDFVEKLPPGTEPSRIALSGEELLLIYRPEAEDKRSENAFLKRIEDWDARLRSAGAKSVCRIPVWGMDTAKIVNCFK